MICIISMSGSKRLRISAYSRSIGLPFGIVRGEHHALAGIRVVRNGDDLHALLFEARQPGPQPLFPVDVDVAHRPLRHVRVPEEDVAVEVAALRRGAPLEGRDGREDSRLVVLLRGGEDLLPAAHRGLGPGVEGRVLGRLAAVVLDHVLEEPLLALVDRS